MKVLKRNIPLFVLLIGIPGLMYFCSSPTESFVKDPRDYTWSVDTIQNPNPIAFQMLMSSIWGSSSSDVYVCGHTDAGPNIYHYDGDKWAAIDLRDYGLYNGLRNKVYGFSEHDVWIAGGSAYSAEGGYITSELIHYDGNTWQSYEFETRSELEDVWGTSKHDLWACGENGIVIHKNGNEWKLDTIKANVFEGQRFIVESIKKVDETLFALAYKTERPQSFIYINENNEWILVDSFYIYEEPPKWGSGRLFCSSDNRLLSTGRGGIYEYSDGSWKNIYQLNSGFYGIWECVEKEYLLAEVYGKIFLYAHNKFEIIKEFSSNATMAELWGNTNECFIVGRDGLRTYIFHGK